VSAPLAHLADKIEYALLLRGQGSYGEISAKTSIPKASPHRYLSPVGPGVTCPNPDCGRWVPAETDRCTTCGTDIPRRTTSI
jgi:hypothetical protein